MSDIRDLQAEVQRVDELNKKIFEIQDELIWCFLDNKTFRFITTMLDALQLTLESVRTNKMKKIEKMKGDN